MELTLKDSIEILTKRFLFLLLCTLGSISLFFFINYFIIHPSYTASVLLYVNTNDETAASANLNELNYAQKVVATYINILQTKVFYRQVLEESRETLTQKQLKKMTDIYVVNNTEIFEINVTAEDPEEAYRLAQAMQKIAPELIKSIKQSAQISIVDPVVLPTEPSGPNIILNTAIGGAAGLVLAVLLSFFWEIIDANVKNQEDLAQRYHLPILGAIPNYSSKKKRKLLAKFLPVLIKKRGKKVIDPQDEDKRFILTEAYKALRMNLRYSLRGEGCKKIIINSPVPEDGKTTTCSHIAISIAQTGSKVLLLDCDLRKGRLHSIFNLKNSPGISDILSGMVSESEAVQNTAYKNLQVITMGTVPPNPTELLASAQMEELIRRLEKNYDFILIDSPPVNVVSDVLGMIRLVDGIILVVRENMTSHPNIANALAKYKFVEARILGFVINGVILTQGRSKSRYYYYHYSKHD